MISRGGRGLAAALGVALGLAGCAASSGERERRLESLEQAVRDLGAKQARLEEENANLTAQLVVRLPPSAPVPAPSSEAEPAREAPEIRQELARLAEIAGRPVPLSAAGPAESAGERSAQGGGGATAPSARTGGDAARRPAAKEPEAAKAKEAEPPKAKDAEASKAGEAEPADRPAGGKSRGPALYDEALRTHLAGKTQPAREMFTSYIEANPDGALTPNALYWLGETWYSERDYAQAILRFQETVSRFPGHHKAADSLLKIALSYERLGDKANAVLYYRALLDDYPAARVAAQARARLKALE